MNRVILFILFCFLCFSGISQTITARDFLFSGVFKRTQAVGDLRGSIAAFDTALMMKPDYAEAYANRGFTKYIDKDFYGAINDFNKAILLSERSDSVEWTIPLSVVGNMPGLYACHYLCGVSYFILEDSKSGIVEMTKAIELCPELSYAYIFRADIKSFLADFDDAIIDYGKAIDLIDLSMPESYEIFYRRGVAKAETNDHLGASDDFGKSIELNPDFPAAFYYRGLTKLILNDADGGCADLIKAEEMGFQQASDLVSKHCK